MLIVALVIFGLFAALTFGGLRLGSDAVTRQVRSRVVSNAAIGVTFIEDTIGSVQTVARSLASDPEMVAAVGNGDLDHIDADRALAVLGPASRWAPGIAAMAVITRDGRLGAAPPTSAALDGFDFTVRDWFRGVTATDAQYVSEVYVSQLTPGQRVVAVATPIRSVDGRTVAYLLVTYEVDAIESFVDRYASRGVLFTVTDQRGIVVAWPGPLPTQLVSQLDDPYVVEALSGESGNRDQTAGGEDWVSAYAPVAGLGWTVRADVAASDAYASVNALRRTVLLLAGVLAVALCGALLFVARSINRRRRAESQARHAASRLEADRERLASIVAAQHEVAAAGTDTEHILVTVAEWARKLTRADGVGILLPEGDELVVRSALGDTAPALGVRLPAGFFADLSEHDATIRDGGQPLSNSASAGLIGRLRMESFVMISLPLVHGAATAGLLMVSSRVPDAFAEPDAAALKLIAGMAGMALAEAASFATIEDGERRHRAVTDNLPDTAVMVWDTDLRLETVTGPGARTWRYAERGVLPGRLLAEIVSPAEEAILGPLYRSGLLEPRTLEYHSKPTGLDFLFETVPVFAADGTPGHVLVMVRDITRRKQDTEALRVAEKRFRTAFEAAPVGIAELDLEGRFSSVNPAMCELTGYEAPALLATTWMAITQPDDVARNVAGQLMMSAGLSDEGSAEMRLVRADGAIVWVSVSTAVVFDGQGKPNHLLSHYLDITERKRFDIEVQHLADHDPLTGLRNRRSFEAELDRHVATVATCGPCGALLVLDLDHFKQVNDTQGHGAGDEMIVALANVLVRRLRTTDVIARLGGDEFAVILPVATIAQAEQVARSIIQAVRDEMPVPSGGGPQVTASIGIAMFDEPGLTGKQVLNKADLSMYGAKSAGRDRYMRHASTSAG